jgi:hypothetical protein
MVGMRRLIFISYRRQRGYELAFLTVLASLVLGAREIIGLTEEFRREREAPQALERNRADERRAAEQRQLEADARSDQLARELAALEKRRSDRIPADEDREQRAMGSFELPVTTPATV